MFDTILIANRGEIACRIIKTARALGIKTIAVFSSADKDSLHVQMADAAYWVGDSAAKDSYLNIKAIIQVAKESKVQAIHPGYGFLSENPEFAKACETAKIVFIGPSISAMEAMASKQLAKQLLEKTTVPLTPGYHGQEQSEAHLLAAAKKIGFPVLIKAANGGGGKGMRAVHDETAFAEALSSAKRESTACFADDTMILEKLIISPRHVEIQIMADNHGNVVHLFERDCSIQRRHQKIIEEAPAPNLSNNLRRRLSEAACEVARSIQYCGAGTIEFLVDAEEQFYFMEMNTRLQVEHPVTEMITGLDLVAWQLKIAANEPLPLSQGQIKAQGHSIECRIYAEDPYQNFIPSIGQLIFLEEPHAQGIRIDTGVTKGSQISMYYDPMIAKLIAFGSDRSEALKRLEKALSSYYIGGLKTNIPFLQAICQHPNFKNAKLSTHFLSQEDIHLAHPDPLYTLLLAVSFDYLNTLNNMEDPLLLDTFSWQGQGLGHWIQRYQDKESYIEVTVYPINNHEFKASINNEDYLIKAELESDKLVMWVNKEIYKATVNSHSKGLTLYTDKGSATIIGFNWSNTINQEGHKGQLIAPMPATVVAILKKTGDAVKTGDKLMVLEAMKMEHSILAPQEGFIKEIFYTLGDQVDEGAELIALMEPN